MVLDFKNVHTEFKINGVKYSHDSLKDVAQDFIKKGESHEKDLGEFLIEWLNDCDVVNVKTSGSTGTPKDIQLKKQAMISSAMATGKFFKLKSGDRALHCLPSTFIAGKMMLIRALVLGLDLDIVSPKIELDLDRNKTYQFAAMLPIQLDKNWQKAKKIKTIIVGGAAVSEHLKKKILKMPNEVFETYGMTETITHIAARRIDVEVEYFKVLPNITISQDDRDCLIIEAPLLTEEKIRTNDVVKFYSSSEFEWLGRSDNVINSGGLKLYPESIEKKLASQIQERFFIASEPDSKFGERIILVIEGSSEIDIKKLSGLEKYEYPKKCFVLSKFIETSSGKIQRSKTLELIK